MIELLAKPGLIDNTIVEGDSKANCLCFHQSRPLDWMISDSSGRQTRRLLNFRVNYRFGIYVLFFLFRFQFVLHTVLNLW